jgi:hypothetical protein
LQVAEAWERVQLNDNFARYHQKTGGAMTIDGSEDHLIQPQGTQNYSFPDADLIEEKAAESKVPVLAEQKVASPLLDEKKAAMPLPAENKADSAPALGEGKDEKQVDAEPEAPEDGEEQKQQVEFFDSEGEDDDKEDSTVTIETALPEGFAIDPIKPALDSSLVGSDLLFCWAGFGWERLAVVEYHSTPKTKKLQL